MKRSIEQTFKDYTILLEQFHIFFKETRSKESESEQAAHMVVSRVFQRKVEMFIKHEQIYINFEEDGNEGPLSVETEQPCITTNKLLCVKQ